MFLVGTPLSKGYDFIGPIIARTPIREEPVETEAEEQLPVEEESEVVEEASVEEETVAETEAEDEIVDVNTDDKLREETLSGATVPPETVDSESDTEEDTVLCRDSVAKEKPSFYELDYSSLLSGNAIEKLPSSDSGNYVIVYSSQNCPYCEKLISELKGNIGDYILVKVKCSGYVQDVFYSRWIYYYPSYIVIKNKQVTYYGYGYRTLEEFRRLL